MTHDLKIWPGYFAAILDGSKTFEVRVDDRGYAVGDLLRLREWSPVAQEYTGREVTRRVTYVLREGLVREGIGDSVVLALSDPLRDAAAELLAALEDLVSLAVDDMPVRGRLHGAGEAALDVARAAIAKARGVTP